jgi:tetratricopeptide (TPR) repeat protein
MSRAAPVWAVWMAASLVLGGVSFVAPRAAIAATPLDVLGAERAYEAGKALLAANQPTRALEVLEASQRLDPALGTVLLIAECHERLGHLVEARATYTRAVAEARAKKKVKSEGKALERIAALDARIAELQIVLDTPSDRALVSVDGKRIDPSMANKLDPGEHSVEVLDRGEAWKETVTLAEGEHRSLPVPHLAPSEPPVAPPPPAPIPLSPAPAPVSAPPKPLPTRSLQSPIGLGVAALGSVVVGMGIGFGAAALGQKSEAAEFCPDRLACRTQVDADRWTSAATAGSVSTVFFVTGAILIVGGGLLWLTAPTHASRTVSVLPSGLGGTF